MVEFGEQLRKAREAKGMTQQTLAEKIYVTRQAVSRWECGDRYPDLLTTKKISQVLEVSIDKLLSEDEMKVITERNPIIESVMINNLVIILYAFITFSFLAIVVNYFFRIPSGVVEIPLDLIYVMIFNCIGMVIQIGIFASGLVMALKGALTPKKSGIVAIVYFASLCLVECNRMIPSGRWQMAVVSLLYMVPWLAAAIASYYFFCKAKHTRICSVILIVVSTWGIFLGIVNTRRIILNVPSYGSMNSVIELLLRICIYLLFIYQVVVLNKKRKFIAMQ